MKTVFAMWLSSISQYHFQNISFQSLAEFAPAGAKKAGLIFRGDMRLAKNTSRGADFVGASSISFALDQRTKAHSFRCSSSQNGTAGSILKRTFCRNLRVFALARILAIPANKDAREAKRKSFSNRSRTAALI
jgi:hypothetical protein